MKISELKKHLKEIKEIIPYKDSHTEVSVPGREEYSMNRIQVYTEIGGYQIFIKRDFDREG